MNNTRIAIAAGILFLSAAATAAVAIEPEESFSLDLSPLHRVSTQPTLQAGTYASAAPHGSHHHTAAAAHHHTL